MPPIFRPAEPADIPALHALIERAYRGESAKRGWTHEADLLGGQRTDPEAIAEIISDPKQIVLLAERDGFLVGCVQVVNRGGGVAYLGLLTVDPGRQASGLGRALINSAEQHARESGASTMEMSVIRQRSELIEWYNRRGYTLTGREAPFPLDDPRFGLPKTRDLAFVILAKRLA